MGKKIYKNVTDFLEAKIDDDMVLMHIQTADYLGMNQIATRIWELLLDPLSVDELIQKLLEEYEVEEEQCRKDVENLLISMKERGLIRMEE